MGSALIKTRRTYKVNDKVKSRENSKQINSNGIYLTDLPDLVLLEIATFLSNTDLTSFSSTCWKLHRLLPRTYFVHRKDKKSVKQFYYDSHFGTNQFYFDTPPLLGHLKSVEMFVEWKDQGTGKRKAYIFIHLLRGSDTIVKTDHCCRFFNAPAPHEFEYATCSLSDSVAVNKQARLNCNGLLKLSQKGDVLRFFLNCGGGGGHEMTVRNFKMITLFSKEY